jgi:hypothetical protein
VSLVLAVFMGGLALGARLLGGWGDRTRSPLRLYGQLEIGIGLAGLLVSPLLRHESWHYVGLVQAIGERPMNLETKKYRNRSGWLPYAEIAVGFYFVGMIVFALQTYIYFATPFLLIFVAGYWWAGFGTLYQEYQSKLRWLKQRRLELAQLNS